MATQMDHSDRLAVITRDALQALGEPFGDDVYGYDARALDTIRAWMSSLSSLPSGSTATVSVPSVSETDEFATLTVPTIRPTGNTLVLIEPHCDDVALSFLGSLLCWSRPVTVITLFNRSRTVDSHFPGGALLSHDEISAVRRAENEAALVRGLGARCLYLDLWEEPWPWSSPDRTRVSAIAKLIESVADLSSAELIAPFGLSTHPDHYLARAAAERLGCTAYWEDLGFFREYARCFEDRMFGRSLWPGPYRVEFTALDQVIATRMALLLAYRTQLYVPEQAMTLLRYFWGVARDARAEGRQDFRARFAERVYRRA